MINCTDKLCLVSLVKLEPSLKDMQTKLLIQDFPALCSVLDLPICAEINSTYIQYSFNLADQEARIIVSHFVLD